MEAETRVLIVEDNFSTRIGIREYLIEQGMEVKEASNTTDALQLVEDWTPSVVVVDIAIPSHPDESANWRDDEGIRVAKLIKEHHPTIGIVLYSSYPYYRSEVLDLAKHGYGGLVYLFKGGGPPEELQTAIQQAMEGRLVLDPQVSQGKVSKPDEISRSLTDQERDKVEYAISLMPELTEREWDVVELVAASRTNAGIAKELCITVAAVQTHLTHIYAKVGLVKGEGFLDKRALLTRAYWIHRNRHV